MEEWASHHNLTLLLSNNNNIKTFNSERWKKGYNPDLAFTNKDHSANFSPTIHDPIPHSQHRPITVELKPVLVPRESNYLPRFNFRKASWESFSEQLDSLIYNLNPDPTQYQAFQNLVWKTAKANIPRGCRRKYVPGLTDAGAELYKQYISQFESDPFHEQTKQSGESLLNQLTKERKARWKELITNIDLTHNSKKAWKTIKNLNSENKPPSRVAAITPNQVAHQLLLNGKPDSKHNWSPKFMKMQFQQVMQDSSQTTKPISLIEVQEAIKHIKPGKASGLDGITPEMINHFGPTTRKWILALFNQCLENSKIPKIMEKSKSHSTTETRKNP